MGIITKDWGSGKDIGLFIIRVVFGLVILFGHGIEKMQAIFGGQDVPFADPLGLGPHLSFYLAAFAEGICTIFLILGLFSRLAAMILTINFIAIMVFHAFIAKDGFGVLEMRYLYLATFIALSFMGAGKFSLDNLLFWKKNE